MAFRSPGRLVTREAIALSARPTDLAFVRRPFNPPCWVSGNFVARRNLKTPRRQNHGMVANRSAVSGNETLIPLSPQR